MFAPAFALSHSHLVSYLLGFWHLHTSFRVWALHTHPLLWCFWSPPLRGLGFVPVHRIHALHLGVWVFDGCCTATRLKDIGVHTCPRLLGFGVLARYNFYGFGFSHPSTAFRVFIHPHLFSNHPLLDFRGLGFGATNSSWDFAFRTHPVLSVVWFLWQLFLLGFSSGFPEPARPSGISSFCTHPFLVPVCAFAPAAS